MKVLVINAGSSSLKYQCIDMETECCLAKGMCDRIGIDDGFFKQSAGEKYVEKQVDIPDHATAIRLVSLVLYLIFHRLRLSDTAL